MCSRIQYRHPIIFTVVFLCLFKAASLHAQNALPDYVQAQLQAPLVEVGSGTYTRFGFSVYHATLWSANGTWDDTKPHALELRYTRSLSKDTLVNGVTDDLREQGVADENTLTRWNKFLDSILPAVKDGDTIVSLAIPGRKSLLFYNGTKIAAIEDQAFIKAFFNIWLGEHADEDLREKLLRHGQ